MCTALLTHPGLYCPAGSPWSGGTCGCEELRDDAGIPEGTRWVFRGYPGILRGYVRGVQVVLSCMLRAVCGVLHAKCSVPCVACYVRGQALGLMVYDPVLFGYGLSVNTTVGGPTHYVACLRLFTVLLLPPCERKGGTHPPRSRSASLCSVVTASWAHKAGIHALHKKKIMISYIYIINVGPYLQKVHRGELSHAQQVPQGRLRPQWLHTLVQEVQATVCKRTLRTEADEADMIMTAHV